MPVTQTVPRVYHSGDVTDGPCTQNRSPQSSNLHGFARYVSQRASDSCKRDKEASGLLTESTAEARSGQRDTEGGIMRDPSRFLGAVLLGVALWAPPALAQSVDTGILGTVSDGSGAVIPGPDITVTSVATKVVHNTVTQPNGTFEVRYLLPGEYIVQASLTGFRTERTTVTLRVGQLARLTFTLQVGSLGEAVEAQPKGL